MKAPAAAAATLVACVAVVTHVRAQPNLANAKVETRSAARGLEREIGAIAQTGQTAWIGYRMPMVAGSRQMCCADGPSGCCGVCRLDGGGGVSLGTTDDGPSSFGREDAGHRVRLEPAAEFLIFARLENRLVTRVRTFTADCALDAGGTSVVWLTDVKPEESLAWLTSLVMSASGSTDRVGKTAVGAIALHDSGAADRRLETFAASTEPEWLRSHVAFWLGSARGEAGARLLARMLAQDPSESVREKVIFGLSVSRTPSALTTLLTAAKDDRSSRIRSRAIFWLSQRAGKEAVAAITNAIDNDPETEVKKKAVFALSQLPKDEGVPKLIEVARTHRNPAVRRTAFFWLGQSKDPRAVKFFEEILVGKQP